MSAHKHIKRQKYINQTPRRKVQNTDPDRVFWPATVATLSVQLAWWKPETLKSCCRPYNL